MRNAADRIHQALLDISPAFAMTAALALACLLVPAAPVHAMLSPDSIGQLLGKAGLQTGDMSAPVIWKLYSEETESADPQETRAVTSRQAWRGYVPVDGSQPSGYASGNSDDFSFDITIEFITLDYLGEQRSFMLTAEDFREHYLNAARKEVNSSYETSVYNGLPGGVIRIDHADVSKHYADIGSSMHIYFWKGPGYVGHVYYSGSCTPATPYRETLRARTVRQEAFIREDCPKIAGILYGRMPDYRALAGADPSAVHSGAPLAAGKTEERSSGQSSPSTKQPDQKTEPEEAGQASTTRGAGSSGKLADTALPVAVGATAALAALGALAAAFANGVPAREVVDGVVGLFNTRTDAALLPPMAPAVPDAGAAVSARRALDAIEAATQQYAPRGWQTQHGEAGSAPFRQLATADAMRSAPSGASLIMSDDEAGRPQSMLDANLAGRWAGISERAHAAYKRGDYAEVERLQSEGWRQDMQHMGYSVAKETEANLKVLEKFKESTTHPAGVVHKYIEDKLHRKIAE